MEFDSMAKFAAHLLTREAAMLLEARRGLKEVAEAIGKTARGEFGVYQDAVGPFPAWDPLAESTVADRVAKGFAPDEPLLRTGELRDSISEEVAGFEAIVGSTSDVMVYQELGTDKIPPRPVLGPAAIHNHDKIRKIMGKALVVGLLGSGAIRLVGYAEQEVD